MISRPRIGLLCVIVAAATSLFATTGSAAAAGTIEGEVVDSVTTVGIQGVEVCALEPAELEIVSCATTDADGEYALGGLADGGYLVEFWAPFLGYATQYFDGVSSFEDAGEVVVSGGPVPGIDAEMEEGGKIEGRVTDVASGAGIGEIEVCAFAFGIGGRCTRTNSFGDYHLISLASGSYLVEFWDELGEYETLFYDQQTSFESAKPVGVTAPNATTGIGARLSKPASGVITRPSLTTTVPPVIPIAKVIKKPKPKAVKCRKAFKKVKRHGRKVCVKKHKKKKHRS
jgi:hypothetical protein